MSAYPLMIRRAGVVTRSRRTGCDPGIVPDACPASSYENVAMNDWPLQSYLELGAMPSAVPCARLHAKQMLWEWGLERFTDSVELIISELTTNAITAARGVPGSWYDGQWTSGIPPVRLWLCSDKTQVLIQVWDGNDQMPEPQASDLLAESGRGLVLVETLCAEWGTFAPEGGSGKVVWGTVNDHRSDPLR